MMTWKTYVPISLMTILSACGNTDPEALLRAEILNIGFIPYEMPLEFAGTGTIVGGKPYRMQLVAPPETCFPREISGAKTNLRFIDSTDLPQKSTSFHVTGNARVGLINTLGNGNSPLSMGVAFDKAQRVDFSYTRPKREYFDSIRLTDFYRHQLPEICKDYLDLNKVGFIVEALKVDEMRFKFYGSNGSAIDLTATNPRTMIQIGIGTSWKVENNYELVISTPKYIGYRMGRLKRSDGGVSLCHANKLTKDGNYEFDCLNTFRDFGNSATQSFIPQPFRVEYNDIRESE